MKRYWLTLFAMAALLSGLTYHHQARPFSETEWTADWDGGPDHDSREYQASIAAGQRLAKDRQDAAFGQAVLMFVLVSSIGVAGRTANASFASSK
jgi:hypothetical protein